MAVPQQNDLTTWVRNYVHYDNLVNNYSKQASGARKLRDEFEDKIIQNLRANRMENAIIQITGGSIQVSEDKSQPSLTLPRIETYLHKYYQQKGNGVDETDAIIRFLRIQRQNDAQTTASLKKTAHPAPIPPPPPSGPLGLK